MFCGVVCCAVLRRTAFCPAAALWCMLLFHAMLWRGMRCVAPCRSVLRFP